MKNTSILLLFVSAIFLLSYSSYAQKKNYQIVAIGFYNCENFFDPTDNPDKDDNDFTPNGPYHYTQEVYKQKKHNIATVFSKMGTDVTPDGPAIIGVVEIENDVVLKDVAQEPEIKARNYKPIWFPTPDVRGISTGMLYNPKYFTLISAEPHTVDLKSIGQSRPTRDILHVCGVLAGDTVHILVNHWPSKSGGEAATAPGRKLAATVAKGIVDSLTQADPNSRVLIMGDLNDNPTSEGVIKVLQAKADKDDAGPNDIYNPWINMYKKGMGTEIFRGEWNLIDQIMISGSFLKKSSDKLFYYKCEIFKRDFLTHMIGDEKGNPHRSFTISQVWDNGYSDHYPVLVYMLKEAK